MIGPHQGMDLNSPSAYLDTIPGISEMDSRTHVGSSSRRFPNSFSENRWQGVCKFVVEMNLQLVNIIGETLINLADFLPI